MVSIKQLLKRLSSKVKKNTADIDTLEAYCSTFDWNYSTEKVANQGGKTYRTGNLTLSKKGLYLVLAHNATSIGATNIHVITLSSNSTYGASNVSILVSNTARSTMQAGGGVSVWALVNALEDNAVIASTGYGYTTSAYTNYNAMFAIRLSRFSEV